jgi:guanine nucleotide-binding protein subunit alpha
MKLIHHGGYSEQEKDSYKEIIFSNTIQSMRCVFLSSCVVGATWD